VAQTVKEKAQAASDSGTTGRSGGASVQTNSVAVGPSPTSPGGGHQGHGHHHHDDKKLTKETRDVRTQSSMYTIH